jgi:hypothetical protein
VQQLVERPAATRRLQSPIQRVQPDRSLEFHFAQDRSQTGGHVCDVHAIVIEFGGRALAEILHQQKIEFVARGIGSRGFRQIVLQQSGQPVAIHERSGLQKLP